MAQKIFAFLMCRDALILLKVEQFTHWFEKWFGVNNFRLARVFIVATMLVFIADGYKTLSVLWAEDVWDDNFFKLFISATFKVSLLVLVFLLHLDCLLRLLSAFIASRPLEISLQRSQLTGEMVANPLIIKLVKARCLFGALFLLSLIYPTTILWSLNISWLYFISCNPLPFDGERDRLRDKLKVLLPRLIPIRGGSS